MIKRTEPLELSLSRDVDITDIEKSIKTRWWRKDKSWRINVPKKLLRNIGKMAIYAVDGEWIRNNVDVTFGTGGHGLVHTFIPMDEIWVDTQYESMESLIFHELKEFNLMYHNDMDYWEAHQMTLEESKGMGRTDKMKKTIELVGAIGLF